MGSKWIRIGDELPPVGQNVWMQLHIPAYRDTERNVNVPEKREVLIGCRDVDKDGGDYYSLTFLTMEDGFGMPGIARKYPWGEVDIIEAWQPMNTPEPEVLK